MDSSTYRHLIGQLPKSSYLFHCNYPSHNLIDPETLITNSQDLNSFMDESFTDDGKFLSNFPCYKPFEYDTGETVSFFCGSGISDESRSLVRQKEIWEKKLKTIKISNIQKAINTVKKLRHNDQLKVTNDLKRYIDHFSKDPEPYFKGNYNWLYSGGNLVKVQHSNYDLLIHSNYWNQQSEFCVSRLNETLDSIDYKTAKKTKFHFPILQICAKCNDDIVMIFVRQKSNASLYKYSSDGLTDIQLLWRKKKKNFKLLTHIDINSNLKEVLVADSNCDVHLFDTETRTKIFDFSLKKLDIFDSQSDCWNQTVFDNYGVYVGTRNCFLIFDPKDKEKKPKLEYFPFESVNLCEEICSIRVSAVDPNYVYVATSHNLVQMDLRKGKTVQRWTHLMKNYPQFIDSVSDENKEFLVMQSHGIEETIGVTNDYEINEGNEYFISRSLPRLLKGIKWSLKLARLNGSCLNPQLVKRFDYDVTGVQCLKNKEGCINLFTANSAGDIFMSKLLNTEMNKPETNGSKERILESMEKYQKHFKNLSPKKKKYSLMEEVDMKHVLKDLREKKSDWKYTKPHPDSYVAKAYAPENLIFYRDVLAEKITEVWPFERKQNMELDEEIISSEDKVREWMTKM